MSDNVIAMQVQSALAGAKKAPRLDTPAAQAQARKVAREFEAFTLSQFLQPMFANTEAAEPFGGGSAETMWRSMQVDEYGKAIARTGGIGIADAVYKEILKMQEAKKP
ncbi:MAG: hypothetical protein A3G18_13460 [Rhodospirillales bacterium RIFCSPLOWO2_12_FULL_58_28]|nr:MAG: hypothetical protein A3H92_13315 [Rhodospirillales bacterium RIFCSPLOWO2_02_FULL_58_16]OHC78580.1 MAG: hypothetical protein A3G18_13460 [Rhodospirillales bacterium RIFCSPLOWO2_12_FULL_58_28]